MSQQAPAVPRPRIQGLSDLIFGLALSIGALQLIGNPPENDAQLLASIGAFGFSFLILINVWNRYTTILSAVPVETRGMVRLNMLLLFLVALEPYLFNLLVHSTATSSLSSGDISTYYGLDLGGMNLVLAYFTHILTREEKGLIPVNMVHGFKVSRNALTLVGLVFTISAIPIFWTPSLVGLPLRFLVWILTWPLISFTRLAGRRHSTVNNSETRAA